MIWPSPSRSRMDSSRPRFWGFACSMCSRSPRSTSERPPGVEALLPLPAGEGREHHGSEEHQEPGDLALVEPGGAADLGFHGRRAVAEDVAQDARALSALGIAEEVRKIVQQASVVVAGESPGELLGALRLAGVVGKAAEEGGQCGRHGLPRGVLVRAELPAELRDCLGVELLVDQIDQGSQCTPPSGWSAAEPLTPLDQ